MKNILKILLLVVLLQSNQDLYASERNRSEKNSYIRVDFGIPYYNKLSEDYEKTRLHGGQLYNVGLGYKFNNNFRADLTIVKRHVKLTRTAFKKKVVEESKSQL